jgi:flagellar biosynthesis anti-sigma factor FlgM
MARATVHAWLENPNAAFWRTMKGISGSPVLDAYHRMAGATPVGSAPAVQGPAPAPATTAGVENAEVKISAKARGLAKDGDAAIDTAKVNDLKAKIASGDLKLDHHKIAARMLERFG